MTKVALDPEALKVNSFETQPAKPGAAQDVWPLTAVDPWESVLSACGGTI